MTTTIGTEKKDMRDAMVSCFTEACERGMDCAVMVSDSMTTAKLAPFAQRFPSNVVNVGIAEQNLTGIAAGLSLGGYTVFTCNAASFLVSRANEQIKNDICYSEANVKMIGLNAGICYANLGSTHHAIDDIAIMRGFGNVQIFAPSDAIEAGKIVLHAMHVSGPVYIRLDNASLPVIHDQSYVFRPGAVDVVREGSDITVCALGSITTEALTAAEHLLKQGISCGVVSCSSVRPLETKALLDSISLSRRVITVEEHSVCGGLGSIVAEVIAGSEMAFRFVRLGIPEGAFAKCGPRPAVRGYHGIDAAGIVKAAVELMRSREERI